jgi:hypothetical protein
MSMQELRDHLEQYLAARSALGLKDRGRKSLLLDFSEIPCRDPVRWIDSRSRCRQLGGDKTESSGDRTCWSVAPINCRTRISYVFAGE